MTEGFSIGAVAKAANVKIPTIRFYEEIGLLPSPRRTDSNRRFYDDATIRRLTFIRHAREFGFETGAIRDLLALADQPQRPCIEADRIARQQLEEISGKIERLTALKSEIETMLHDCAAGEISDCRVIEVLSDHMHCQGEHA